MELDAYEDFKFRSLINSQTAGDSVTENEGVNRLERCYIRNKLMPMLIKEGLKFAIQAKRKSRGLKELKVDAELDKTDSETGQSPPEAPDMIQDEQCDVIQKQLMPMLIKAGLKFAIQAKRKSKGLGELEVEPKPVRSNRLTPEEERKRLLRRERNRLAAAKCRYKKRERAEILERETRQLEEANDKLKADLARLEAEKKHLSETLQFHTVHCPTGQTPRCEQSPYAYAQTTLWHRQAVID
ncbi:activating transcription factor 3-like isoform X2 [Ptychodera flava]